MTPSSSAYFFPLPSAGVTDMYITVGFTWVGFEPRDLCMVGKLYPLSHIPRARYLYFAFPSNSIKWFKYHIISIIIALNWCLFLFFCKKKSHLGAGWKDGSTVKVLVKQIGIPTILVNAGWARQWVYQNPSHWEGKGRGFPEQTG